MYDLYVLSKHAHVLGSNLTETSNFRLRLRLVGARLLARVLRCDLQEMALKWLIGSFWSVGQGTDMSGSLAGPSLVAQIYSTGLSRLVSLKPLLQI